jgi:2Fe-2S ferredoxin
MLTSVAAERRPNSRLCCQIRSAPTLDGLVVTMPAMQR